MADASVPFHRLALQEYEKTWHWYACRSEKAAERFVQAVDKCVQEIADDPFRWPLYDNIHRWRKLHKFPYLLYYQVTAAGLPVVVALSHASRRPGYWKRRRV